VQTIGVAHLQFAEALGRVIRVTILNERSRTWQTVARAEWHANEEGHPKVAW
jgi:hypothetical protein